MQISFEYLLKQLQKYDIVENKIPPIIINGGNQYPIDLKIGKDLINKLFYRRRVFR